ncbi:hypothetical protein PR048_000859 [Dryococelus australis]|uniref:Uncharacterized protein n=1 Tax=Dryococelus australis TaxID=614101 RepID=A0ABQ9II55_9NEOP|nr:hypothetical protein PR048_000859 [Dryococelus australis]
MGPSAYGQQLTSAGLCAMPCCSVHHRARGRESRADDAVGRQVFSGISHLPHPWIPVLLHSHLISPSPALNTSLLRAAQISQLNSVPVPSNASFYIWDYTRAVTSPEAKILVPVHQNPVKSWKNWVKSSELQKWKIQKNSGYEGPLHALPQCCTAVEHVCRTFSQPLALATAAKKYGNLTFICASPVLPQLLHGGRKLDSVACSPRAARKLSYLASSPRQTVQRQASHVPTMAAYGVHISGSAMHAEIKVKIVKKLFLTGLGEIREGNKLLPIGLEEMWEIRESNRARWGNGHAAAAAAAEGTFSIYVIEQCCFIHKGKHKIGGKLSVSHTTPLVPHNPHSPLPPQDLLVVLTSLIQQLHTMLQLLLPIFQPVASQMCPGPPRRGGGARGCNAQGPRSPGGPSWARLYCSTLVEGVVRFGIINPGWGRVRYEIGSRLVFRQHDLKDNGVVVRILISHLREPGSIPSRVTPGFFRVGIVPNNAAGSWIFSGISHSPVPALLHAHLTSPSSAKISKSHQSAMLCRVLRVPSCTVAFTHQVSRPLVCSHHKYLLRHQLAISCYRPSSSLMSLAVPDIARSLHSANCHLRKDSRP